MRIADDLFCRLAEVSRKDGFGRTLAQWITSEDPTDRQRIVSIAVPQRCAGADLQGSLPLPIRWVLTHDPLGKRPAKAIFSTDLSQTAEQIVLDFMKRWSLEVTFEEGRAHLGIETQRQWSDLAIERSTPLLFGLYSLVTLFGQALHPNGQIPIAQAAWYRKQTATFRDVLALVRRHLWGHETFPTSPTDPDAVLVPRSTLERFSLAVC